MEVTKTIYKNLHSFLFEDVSLICRLQENRKTIVRSSQSDRRGGMEKSDKLTEVSCLHKILLF